MVHPYIYTPFGLICKICKTSVSVTPTIERGLYLHDYRSEKHDIKLTPDERSGVVVEYEDALKVLAKEVCDARNNEQLAREIFERFLVFPVTPFPFCSECKTLVMDKRDHKRRRHAKYCTSVASGNSITNWENINAKVIEHPIDFEKESNFSTVYWKLYIAAKNDALLNEDVSADIGTNPIGTDTEDHDDITSFASIKAQFDTWCRNACNRQRPVHSISQEAEPNRWMNRVTWDKHLREFDLRDMFELTKSVRENEPRFEKILQCVTRTMEESVARTKNIDRSNSVLSIVSRIDEKQEKKPFNAHMKDATWIRYIGWMKKIVLVICRLECDGRTSKPSYTLTDRQTSAFANVFHYENDCGPSPRQCMSFLLSLVDQEMENGPFDCILLSAIAIVSLNEQLQFASAKETTPMFAAILAIYRSLVLTEAIHLAIESNQLIKETLQLSSRILMHPRRECSPGPISWILKAFAYAETLSSDEGGTPRIVWYDDEVSFGGNSRLSMKKLIAALPMFIDSTQRLLNSLLQLPAESHRSDLPTIHWEKLEDNLHNRQEYGYSFLNDERNSWIASKRNWVFDRVLKSKDLRSNWLDSSTMLIEPEQLALYERILSKFLSNLLVLVHLTAGQPARGTEITSIRYFNTQTMRNVMIDRGLVCIKTNYHKQFMQYDSEKIIYRFLPAPVGELLVFYLWLVIPFYTKMKGFTLGYFDNTPYLWTEDIVINNSMPIRSENQSLFWGTSSHLTKYLKEFSSEYLDVEVSTMLWRHIAIGIARKYLRSSGVAESAINESGERTDDTNDYLNREDSITERKSQCNIWDLQATHSTRTAERLYAVEYDRGYRISIDYYFNVSSIWHGFLLPGYRSSTSQKSDGNILEREHIKQRCIRLRKLMSLDLQYFLEFFMKNDEATFRGNQLEVLKAIVRGEPIILQVTGTGVGKSLSFMLPAYASPQGTTIVIVPLVSLQNDLVQRSIEKRISAKAWDIHDGWNCLQSLVFVTPESASTQSFSNYVSFLQSHSLLDRIVLDECHTFLQCTNEFRRRMVEIKRIIRSTGVQLVLLTATLPPSYENRLYNTLNIATKEVFKVRSSTSRGNIRYNVRTIGNDSISLVNAIRREISIEGKVIVYVRTIEQGELLAKELDCPFFHSRIGSSSMKARILSHFINSGHLIVATNAMGMGIDIPNIRLVINAGSPDGLLDFVQQSGRAGRDGKESVSLLLHQSKFSIDSEMIEYITTRRCRRSVINKFMDGELSLKTCECGEAECDNCTPNVLHESDDVVITSKDEVTIFSPELPNRKDLTGVSQSCNIVTCCKPRNPYRVDNKRKREANESARMDVAVANLLDNEKRSREDFNSKTKENAVLLRTIKEMLDEYRSVKCIVCKLTKAGKCSEEHAPIQRDIECKRERMIHCFRDGNMLPAFCACRIPGCYLPQIWCKSFDKSLSPLERTCKYKYVLLDLLYGLRSLSKPVAEYFDASLAKSESGEESRFLATEHRFGNHKSINLVFVVFQLFQLYKD